MQAKSLTPAPDITMTAQHYITEKSTAFRSANAMAESFNPIRPLGLLVFLFLEEQMACPFSE